MTTTPAEDDTRHRIDDLDTLAALYGAPGEASIRKEVDHLHAHYRAIVEASPFAVLATAGPVLARLRDLGPPVSSMWVRVAEST